MKKISLMFLFLSLCSFVLSTELIFRAEDKPNDDGSAIILNWNYNFPGADRIIIEKKSGDENFSFLAKIKKTDLSYIDDRNVKPAKEYVYKLNFLDTEGNILAEKTAAAEAKAQWFNTDKISLLILVLILSFAVLYYILSAKSGKELYIRRIAGLDSMDESVGRATEMGKPILFIPGTLDLDDMQTIAGLTILGKLAQKAAEHETDIIVPVCRSMVLSTAKEIVKEAYLKAGRPDEYNPNSVFYLTDDQFGFVAGVDGIMIREKPAANFFLGAFYAESLILAETGFAGGAIQTSGTAMPSQLPFFVVACDYTLIGEELFAASAYLSKDPHQLGSLKGQDFGKAVFVIVLIIGIILEMANVHFLKDFLISH